MGFFEQPENRSDYEKMGIKPFFVLKSKDKWVFEYKDELYDFAPAGMTDASLSPVIIGADRLINYGCGIKEIADYEKGFVLLVSENYFPGCDARITYKEPLYDGWIYDVYSENLAGIMPGQQTWLCPYIRFYYPEPPSTLYLQMVSVAKYRTPE